MRNYALEEVLRGLLAALRLSAPRFGETSPKLARTRCEWRRERCATLQHAPSCATRSNLCAAVVVPRHYGALLLGAQPLLRAQLVFQDLNRRLRRIVAAQTALNDPLP
jgi:hypothetical protein